MTKEQVFKQIEGRIETMQNTMVECIEIIYNAGYNDAIEEAAKWLDTANRNDTDDAKEIRRLKK